MDARWHVVFASEQDRPDIARLRYWWRRYLGRLDPARLVFVDATWAKTNITRTHGWYRRVLPLRGTIPHAHWRTMTFLAAPRQDGITVLLNSQISLIGNPFAEPDRAPSVRWSPFGNHNSPDSQQLRQARDNPIGSPPIAD